MIAKPEVIEQPVMEAAQDENSWRDALNKATTYQDIEDVFSALFGLKPVDEFAGKGIKTDTNIDGEVIELKGNGRIAKLRKSGKWEIYDGEADAKNLYGTAENIADACEIILEQAKSVRKQDAVIIMEAASTGDWQTLKSIFEKAKPEYVPGMFDTAE